MDHYERQYQENRKYQTRYEKSKDPERYYQDHRAELTLYDGSKAFLEREGINPATFDLKGLKDTRNELETARKTATTAYKTAETELKKLEKLKKGLETFIGEERTPAQQKEQNQSL